MQDRIPAEFTQIVLEDNPLHGRVAVNLEAFFEFSYWLAEELEDLVATWSHAAAPCSTRRPARKVAP